MRKGIAVVAGRGEYLWRMPPPTLVTFRGVAILWGQHLHHLKTPDAEELREFRRAVLNTVFQIPP